MKYDNNFLLGLQKGNLMITYIQDVTSQQKYSNSFGIIYAMFKQYRKKFKYIMFKTKN